MGNEQSTEGPWTKCYTDIKTEYDEAYRVVEEASTLEAQSRLNDALDKYKKAILLIDKALNIQVTFPENPNDEFNRACVMIQQLKKTRAEVLSQINAIQASPDFVPSPAPPPPTYDEAIGGATPNYPQTYLDLATALNNLKVDNLVESADIIYQQENAKLYYISPNGSVTATEDNQILKIGIIEGRQTALKAFLQIGDWLYPLVPGVSPCYRTEYGAFVFPDLHSDIPDASVAFMLSEDTDSDVYDLLESILHGIVGEVKKPHKIAKRDEDTSSTVSRKIANGAYYISQGLIKGAQKTGDLLNYTTPKIISKITPRQDAASVPPTLSKSLRIAENATSTAANVTGFVADKIGDATSRLGMFLAPHIRKQGTRILTSGFQLSEQEAACKVDGVLTIAAGAIEGFSTVYRGLETSAGILGNSLKDNSVKIVEHKFQCQLPCSKRNDTTSNTCVYGNNVGEVTADTLNTVGNVFTIAQNSKVLTPKGLVKKTAKETGKAVVKEYRDNIAPLPNSISSSELASVSSTAGMLYPNLPNTGSTDLEKSQK